MKLKLGGRWWGFRYSRSLKSSWGYCDSPAKLNKEIVVDSRLNEQNRLDTTIHEFIHACDRGETLDEQWVDKTATDVARALYRLGWRQSG